MKNFKKVLALVLCVVMALGLISTANAAFTDAESITKTEAVEVLSALKVISGYPDGSFKPEGDVTRAEMAKMVAYIMNEGEDVGDLYKNACAFTDSANHWAAGYIAYCANEGIISGKSPTIFDPDGKVTGTEAAKMLLCALGYNADTEGFKGSTWASAVLSAAAKAHLVGKDYNLTVAMGEPLNRDNAAQMMLNALQATMVEYENQSTITIGGVTINNNSKAQAVENDANIETIKPDQKMQLAEDKFPTLTLGVGGADAFQRVGNEWRYPDAGFVGGPYAQEADLIYKDIVTGGTLYTDTGKIKIADYFVEYFVDGVEDAAIEALLVAQMKSGSTEEFGVTGDTIEVYLDTTAQTIRFVQINYYAGTVVQAWAAKTDANGDVTTDAYIKIAPFNAAHNAALPAELENGNTNTAATIATTAITSADKDAVVVYTYAAQRIQSVAKTTSVSGTQKGYTEVNGDPADVTVDSTTYTIAATATTENGNGYGDYDSDITVYLDPNGNVIYTEAIASNTFAYVMAAGESGEFAGDGEYKARLLFSDGTVKVVQTANDDTNKAGTIVAYSVRTDGKYTLTVPGNYTLPAQDNVFAYTTGTVAINDGNVAVNANDTTVFVVESVDADAVSTYTVYTGIKAVPNVTDATLRAIAKNGDAASLVYLLGVDENNIDTGAASTDTLVLFATAADAQRTVANGATYRQVKAVVNGEVKTLNLDSAAGNNAYARANIGGVTLVNGYTTNSDGIVTKITVVDPATNYADLYADFDKDGDGVYTGTYNNGVISLDGTPYSVTSDVPVYVYNTNAKSVSTSTISAYYPSGNVNEVNVLYDRDKINSGDGQTVTAIAITETDA